MCSRNRCGEKGEIVKMDRIGGRAIVLGEVRKNWHFTGSMTSIRKPITFLAVAQIGTLVYACLISGMTVKIAETIFSKPGFWGDFVHRYFRSAYVMSHCGWMLLVLPVIWFFAVEKYNRTQRDSYEGNLCIYWSGIGLLVLGAWLSVFFTMRLYLSLS